MHIVVTGEVDVGKSTLIGRMLHDTNSLSLESSGEIAALSMGRASGFEFAFFLDSLMEERRDLMTLETTRVFCKNGRGGGWIFIDVPGHQELIKNMLSGSSCADAALVVVDAAKPIEEGTRRHIEILKFLGIRELIFVVNKMDAMNFSSDRFITAQKDIIKFCCLAGVTPLEIIPVSARDGHTITRRSRSIPWYKGASLIEAINCTRKRIQKEITADFCFLTQDVYMSGGTEVCVGSIVSGAIKKGQHVRILPLNAESMVKEIRVFPGTARSACAPRSVGLLLAETGRARRGQVICRDKKLETVSRIKANLLFVSSLKTAQKVSLRCATQTVGATIDRVGEILYAPEGKQPRNRLSAMDAAEVSIVTDEPVVIRRFPRGGPLGKFILQDSRGICAAGIVND